MIQRTIVSIPILVTLLGTQAHAASLLNGIPDPNDPRLAGWWDANDPASQDALQSGTWPDRSSNGRDAVFLGDRSLPFLIPTGSGNDGVYFYSFSGIFGFDPIVLLSDPTSTATIFLVNQSEPNADLWSPGSISSTSSPGASLFSTVGFGNSLLPETQFLFENSSTTFYNEIDGASQVIQQLTLRGDIPERVAEFKTNGTILEPLSVNVRPDISPTTFQISTLGGSRRETWSGTISEVLIYQEALTPEESAQITSYLAEKYQITVIPEPTTPALALLFAIASAFTRRRKAQATSL